MSSIVDFLIKLHTDANSAVAEARKMNKQLDAIEKKAKSVGNQLRHAFSFSGFKDALMSVPGMQFLTNPYTMIGAGIGAITKLGAEAEMTSVAFTTLVGDSERAGQMLKDITEYASKSPFGKLDLTQNAQQMLAFGVEADKVMGYLKQLGDVAAGDKNKLSSLSLVMGQVTAAGKLSGQDLLQFNNMGWNPLQELSQMTGKSMIELKKLMESGAISADHVAQALAHATGEGGKFYQMSDKTSLTTEGRWSSAMDNLQESAIKLFEIIQPYILDFLDLFNRILPPIMSGFEKLFGLIDGVIKFVKSWWQELTLAGAIIGIIAIAVSAKTIAITALIGVMHVVTWVTKVWTGVQWLLNVALNANPIGLVIVAVASLTAVIVYCWNKFAGFRAFLIVAWDTLKQLGTIIKDSVLNRINELLEGIGNVGKALQQLLSGDFRGAWDTMGNAVKQLTGYNSATTALSQGKELVGVVKGQWQDVYAKEQAKDAKGEGKSSESAITAITEPKLKGSAPMGEIVFGEGTGKGKGKKGKKDKTAEAIATGGSRPTTINISIGKLIESQNISMLDKSNPEELERVVLQALNRSLAIATSTE